jgi:hypothetical protein
MRPSINLIRLTLVFAIVSTGAVAQQGHGFGHSTHGPMNMNRNSHAQRASAGSAKDLNTRLSQNKQLSSKLEGLLKLSGPNALTQLQADAKGFKNLGQFVAAVHVSNNLGVPFSTLKQDMLTKGGSLGKAIQAADPKASARTEIKKAKKQADADLDESKS